MSGNNTLKRVWVLFSGHVQGVFFRDGIEDKAHKYSLWGGVQNLKPPEKRVWAIFEESQESQGNVGRMLRWCAEGKVSDRSNIAEMEVIHETPPKGDSKTFKRWVGRSNTGEHIRLRAILLPKDPEADFSAAIQAEAGNQSIIPKLENLNGPRRWIAAIFEGPSEKVNEMRNWCLANAEDFEEIEYDTLGNDNNFGLVD